MQRAKFLPSQSLLCSMTYANAIDYLYRQLPMFSRIGAAAYNKDLTNTILLCNALQNPQQQFKSIHVAGTNGKGSVSHMLAAIMQCAGFKTGLYTSPHLKDFRERIKVNGKVCEEDFVVNFLKRILPESKTIKPSFFELTVAMAFEYFKIQQVDIAIIETGLGGRFDSTNIIHPELSVITNIGWDHMNILGDSLEKIAFEKAGIIKEQTTLVVGESNDKINNIFLNIAKEKQAEIFFADEKYFVNDWKMVHHHLQVSVTQNENGKIFEYLLDLPGVYQLKNIVTVLEAVNQLSKAGWHVAESDVRNGLQNTIKITGLHGRWEVIHQHPTVILDVAHNINGLVEVRSSLEHLTYEKLHIVFGMVKDKDAEEILKQLPKFATYYFTKAQIPRALDEEELLKKASAYSLLGKAFSDVNAALSNALQHAAKDDLILICGSVYLVGEVEITKGLG